MTKRARPQSAQEQFIDAHMGADTDTGFDAKKHIAVTWKPKDLRKGDRIVTAQDQKTGKIIKTLLVKEIDHEPRGCRSKVHINSDVCWDYASTDLQIALHAPALSN